MVSNVSVISNRPKIYLHTIFFLYVSLTFFKKYFIFNDGVLDIAILLCMVAFLSLSPKQLARSIKALLKERVFQLFVLFTFYFFLLSLNSYNTKFLIALEFVSVFKWIIYFFIGYLFSKIYRVHLFRFPIIFDIVLFTIFLLGYSIFLYNWSNMGAIDNLFGFYNNSFESVFSLRSVFALFAFLMFIYSVNYFSTNSHIAIFLFCSSFIFLFMSGNRKMLLAVLIVFLFMNVAPRFKSIMRLIKIVIGVTLIFLVSQSALYKASVEEYSNFEQPRIATYRTSFLIAKEYFPFGSGPATFASKGSMVNYSPLYEEYGLDERWGFRPDDEVHFYNDTYWAQIISQYGFLGVFLILWIFYEIIKMLPNIHQSISYKLQLNTFLLISLMTPALQRIEVALFVFFVIGVVTNIGKTEVKHKI